MVLTKMALLPIILATSLLAACQPESTPLIYREKKTAEVATPVVAPQATEESKRVLLVINSASPESRDIGAYYRAKRQIPKENVVLINVSTTENISETEFNVGIKNPVNDAIKTSKNQVDFIVLTSGTPIRLKDNGGNSVDGALSTMNLNLPPIAELKNQNIICSQNPYYGATTPFSSKKYNMYLVTRLIGYTVEDAKKLVDNSLIAKKTDGPFFLDKAGNRTGGGYGQLQTLMDRANDNLIKKGLKSTIDTAEEFQKPSEPLMGYITWGSNDGKFDPAKYKAVKFLPGSICETFVSTSARTFKPTTEGQSLIADLIANGVTGVKGYVSEPFTFALAQPDILFDRYTNGMNLAESFYAASQVCKWKDLVVGDPLCNPYKQ